MSISLKLDKDKKGENVDIKVYRDMIRFLRYLFVSIPNIIMSQGVTFAYCQKNFLLFAWNG